MATKKSYNRFFIIFQEEDKGYGIGADRPPTGYAKLETKNDKGKITIYAQNLKPFENGECLYKCYLISHKDEKDTSVYLGMMNIDELGRGESTWECAADNAFDSKISIDKFNGAAIVVDKFGADKVIAPLAGYMSKEKFDWRGSIPLSKTIQKSVEEVKVEVKEVEVKEVEVSEEAKKFEEYERMVEQMVAKNKAAEEKIEIVAELQPIIKESHPVVEVLQPIIEESHPVVEVLQPIIEESHPIVEELEAIIEEVHPVVAEELEAIIEEVHPVVAEELQPIVEESHPVLAELQPVIEESHIEAEEMVEEVKYEEEPIQESREPEVEEIFEKKEDMEEFNMGGMGHSYFDPTRHKHHDKNKYPCPDCMECYKINYKHMIKDILEEILDDFEEMDKHKDLKACKLWKISMKKCEKHGDKVGIYPGFDLIFYPMMENPYCSYFEYIKRHGHYLFGIQYDENRASRELKRLVFGIPGANSIFEQPFQGATGFLRWIPWGRDGYWIMTYDPMTGEVDF